VTFSSWNAQFKKSSLWDKTGAKPLLQINRDQAKIIYLTKNYHWTNFEKKLPRVITSNVQVHHYYAPVCTHGHCFDTPWDHKIIPNRKNIRNTLVQFSNIRHYFLLMVGHVTFMKLVITASDTVLCRGCLTNSWMPQSFHVFLNSILNSLLWV